MQIDSNRCGGESRACCYLWPGHALDQSQHQSLAIRFRQTAYQLQDLCCPRVVCVAAPQFIVDLHRLFRAAMEIDCAIMSDHRDPGSERRAVAQRVKLLESVQEDVLDKIVDFRAWHTSQQNAVHEWCVTIVKP